MNFLANIDFWNSPFKGTLLLLLISGALFCPWLALWARTAESLRRKAFFGHLAKQITQAAFLAGLLVGAGFVFFYITASGLDSPLCIKLPGVEETNGQAVRPGLPSGFQELAPIACAAMFIILQAFVLRFWKTLRKHAPLQIFLLALSALAAAGAVGLMFYFNIDWPTQSTGAAPTWTPRHSIFNVDFPAAWAYAGAALLACASFAAALALAWLLSRRDKADYGRDYYNFAISRLSGVACGLAVLSLLASGGLALAMHLGYFKIVPGDWRPLAGAAAAFVICALLWLRAARSRSPLRNKAGLWLCLPLAALAVALICLSARAYAFTAMLRNF